MPLTDAQWARIELILPDRTPKRGGRWRDRREVIDAIVYKFQTGMQWVHLPEKHGNWRGVYNRLRMWAVDGTWERVFTALQDTASLFFGSRLLRVLPCHDIAPPRPTPVPYAVVSVWPGRATESWGDALCAPTFAVPWCQPLSCP
ncbi:transposase [Streptomyces thinghirensis]|uniref:Insertion element IS402-like domain-containing protein n=1 Tax=Streptomyces thinghirensis TaxID=551547 RepID=A0ABP9TEW1_9ACTN